jgi:hypothetical protein
MYHSPTDGRPTAMRQELKSISDSLLHQSLKHCSETSLEGSCSNFSYGQFSYSGTEPDKCFVDTFFGGRKITSQIVTFTFLLDLFLIILN